MAATDKNSVVESRLTELKAELSEVNATLGRIDEAIATLQRQAETDPDLSQDAEFVDRMTVEGGRRRIMERRKSEIETEINRLESMKRA